MICTVKTATVYRFEVKKVVFRALDQSQYIELFYKQFKYSNSLLKEWHTYKIDALEHK